MFKGSCCFSWFAVGMKIAVQVQVGPWDRHDQQTARFERCTPNSVITTFRSPFVFLILSNNAQSR